MRSPVPATLFLLHVLAGAVWISPAIDASERAPVTAAIVALLLFEELRKTLPE